MTSLPRNVAGQQPSLFCPLTVTVPSTAPNTEVCSVDILRLAPGGPFLILLLYINEIVHKLRHNYCMYRPCSQGQSYYCEHTKTSCIMLLQRFHSRLYGAFDNEYNCALLSTLITDNE